MKQLNLFEQVEIIKTLKKGNNPQWKESTWNEGIYYYQDEMGYPMETTIKERLELYKIKKRKNQIK